MYLEISVDDLNKTNYLNLNETNMFLHKQDVIDNPSLLNYIKLSSFVQSDTIDLYEHPKREEILIELLKHYGYLIEHNSILYFDYFRFLPIANKVFTTNKIFTDKTKQHILIYNKECVKYLDFNEDDRLLLERTFMNNLNRLKIDKPIHLEYSKFLKDVSYKVYSFTKINDINEFVLTQFKIYLSTQLRSIPFNNGFGSLIKHLLQKKYSDEIVDLIKDEITGFVGALNKVYKSDNEFSISVNKIEVEENKNGFSTVVTVYVFLIINDSPFNFVFDAKEG
jgi:hypothetical protein